MRRFRLFAGPNGSGKSTLYKHLRNTRQIHTEVYVSADRIEAELKQRGKFTFNAYRIRVSEEEFQARIDASKLLSSALLHAERAYLIDNSSKFDTVAMKDHGKLKWLVLPRSAILSKYLTAH